MKIDMNETKEFKDIYLDGTEDTYLMTFGELVNTFGYDDALIWWEGGNPYDD